MRIGIVNDMPVVAEALRRVLLQQPGYQVIWTARDGVDAVERCRRDRPDVVLMDLIMPGMSGVEATRRIMAQSPCAILIVTSDVGANASDVFEAMGHGAVDAVDTPAPDARSPGGGAAPLLAKLENIARNTANGTDTVQTLAPLAIPDPSTAGEQLVAIGASAGGPAALSKLLGALPRRFPAAIVIVQHIDQRFSPELARWLTQQSGHPVRLAEDGDRASTGSILLARGDDHLCLTRFGELRYSSEPSGHAYRPSVDVFFESVCRFWQYDAVGVLLTGMGRDGASGLKSLRSKGHHTITQDRATSTVYGMPKAAVLLDAADEILPLGEIAPRLTTLCPPAVRAGVFR